MKNKLDKIILLQITKVIINELESAIKKLDEKGIKINSDINTFKKEIEDKYQDILKDLYNF